MVPSLVTQPCRPLQDLSSSSSSSEDRCGDRWGMTGRSAIYDPVCLARLAAYVSVRRHGIERIGTETTSLLVGQAAGMSQGFQVDRTHAICGPYFSPIRAFMAATPPPPVPPRRRLLLPLLEEPSFFDDLGYTAPGPWLRHRRHEPWAQRQRAARTTSRRTGQRQQGCRSFRRRISQQQSPHPLARRSGREACDSTSSRTYPRSA